MRTGIQRWAAAVGTPLALLAVAGCGAQQDSGGASHLDGRSVSSTNDSERDGELGRASGETSRDSGARGDGALGETAGPGGELGPEDGLSAEEGRVPAQWPADDVTGTVPRRGEGRGTRTDPVRITYDAQGAAGFVRAVRAGAAAWDERVPEIELRPAREGTEPDVRIVAAKGWPSAAPEGSSPGKGTVIIGRRALAQGYDAIRIVSHELGHLLGLEDKQPGPCSSVMSGKSAGTACTDATPSAAEVREVRRNFRAAAEVG